MKIQRHLDAIDLEAMKAGAAIAQFRREYKVEQPVKAKAKRGVVRGKIGADSRRGLGSANAATAKAVSLG